MAKATVKLWKDFPAITDEVRKMAVVALERAESEALATINREWDGGDFREEGVSPTLSGFKSGVSAGPGKKHIAQFHDHGTLGHFRRGSRTEPKRPRKKAYKMTRADGSPTGIKAQRFYGKGRAAGKRAMLRSLGI